MSEDFYTIKIGSMYYRITSDEDADYVNQIAKRANELLAEVKSKHSGLSDAAAAVLALLNVLDQCHHLEHKDSGVYQQLAECQQQLAQVEAERLRLREELWELKKDLLYYRNLCEVYEERLSNISLNLGASASKASGKRSNTSPLDEMQQTFADMEVYDSKTK
ncbi:MAG: cell division protein ZapA [Eubacteriales bacterium]|nr:cell division protein ZapA [Eubacteriales bacterium]